MSCLKLKEEAYRIANDYQEFVDDRGLKLEQPYKGHKSRKTNKNEAGCL